MSLPPSINPTMSEIYRAAAWWAGEGSIRHTPGLSVSIAQKETAVVNWIRERFGGSVLTREINGRPISYWQVHGMRARAFLMTIYSCIPESPRRQEMIRLALLATNSIKRRGSKPTLICRHGHPKEAGKWCRTCAAEYQRRIRATPEGREKHRIQQKASYHRRRARLSA